MLTASMLKLLDYLSILYKDTFKINVKDKMNADSTEFTENKEVQVGFINNIIKNDKNIRIVVSIFALLIFQFVWWVG